METARAVWRRPASRTTPLVTASPYRPVTAP
jgi:hypothetical protein